MNNSCYIKSLKIKFKMRFLHFTITYRQSNHTLYSQSFSSKQKTSASVPKSLPCLIHLLQPQHRSHCPNKAYLWSRSKCWMRAHRANIQHAATKITNMPYWGNGFVCSLLNELNSNSVYILTLYFFCAILIINKKGSRLY